MLPSARNSTNWCSVYVSILQHLGGEGGEGGASVNHSSLLPGLGNCSQDPPPQDPPIVTSSLIFYTYSVPVILAIGLLGNVVSLRVFLSRSMRKLSASTYLAALSTSDILALVFYVLMEWLR